MKIRTNKRTGCTIKVYQGKRSSLFMLESPTTGSDHITVFDCIYKRGDKLPERVAEHWKGFLANQK